jgi:hypothetical protein
VGREVVRVNYPSRQGKYAVAAALLVALVFRLSINAALLSANPLPVGNDGSWHLARPANIGIEGRVPDGSVPDPVEKRFYEYPVPYHLLILVLNWSTSLGRLTLFRLLHFVQPLVHVLLVYALLRPSLGRRYASLGAIMAAGTVSTGHYHGLLFAYPSTLGLLLLLASMLLLRHGRTGMAVVVLLAGFQTHYAVATMGPIIYLLLAIEPMDRRPALTVLTVALAAFVVLWLIPTFATTGHLPKAQTVRNAADMVPGARSLLERWFPTPPAEDRPVERYIQVESVAYPKLKNLLLLNPVLILLALAGLSWRDHLRLIWLPGALLFLAGFPGSYRLMLFAAQLLPLAAAPALAQLIREVRNGYPQALLLALVLIPGPLVETHLAMEWKQVYTPVEYTDALQVHDQLRAGDVAACDPVVYSVLAMTGENPGYRIERHDCDPPSTYLVLHERCECTDCRRAQAPCTQVLPERKEVLRVGSYTVYGSRTAG